MSQVTFLAASVMGVILEGVLYGIYVPLFLTACYVQWQKGVKKDYADRIMAITTVFYGLILTMHWLFTFIRGLHGVLFLPPGEDMETFFQNTSNPLYVCKVTLLQVEVLVGVWVMIYRLYRFYGRNMAICIVPLVGSLGHFAIIFGSTIEVIRNSDPTASMPWTTASFSIMFFNSLCVSCLIAVRLRRAHHSLPGSRIHGSQSPVIHAMCIVTESAGLWTTFLAINFILFLVKSNLRFTFLDMTGPVIGISFCLIVFRLGNTAKERISLPPLSTTGYASQTGTSAASTSTSTASRRETGQALRNHRPS